MDFKRIFIIVMDSVGCGELEDAEQYGDKGANTIKHISEAVDLKLPNLKKLGYGNLTDIKGVEPVTDSIGYYTKLKELSLGKDTMTGHWEIMGLRVTEPFITFTETGFPDELIKELEEKTGRKVIGNKSASGTEIIKELGEEHMKTGDLIVYTSADSVLQIAAHEEIIPIDELYKICEIAREITLRDEWKLGRVIARPFIGPDKDNFERTANRHDYALSPYAPTVLDHLKESNYDVISLGKISDIYDGDGITESIKTKSNMDGMDLFIKELDRDFHGLCYINLVDFDAKFGHRRNPVGYGEAMMEFDKRLNEVMPKLTENDLLIITADHGNDPVHEGTDHTREYVPFLVYSKALNEPKELPIGESFADIGATVAENFNVKAPKIGKSRLGELK
ncbi:phosphopentomutase [Haloplasma contractile]|uniref:Phosphopentomutase n=1 Tax=Haloplasma contractile SSD-17B TaxID=1033810 RepID=U2EGL7_9MOLU|nr:phosphopentomutase [Haloplasma contractile]ERJ13761.1 Phosphopentomutase Carbohydrate transport protein [Haloplasma contractile SSD-17B]